MFNFLLLFDAAKVRRFPHSHNPMCVAFEYHNYGISTKKASKMRNSTGDLTTKKGALMTITSFLKRAWHLSDHPSF